MKANEGLVLLGRRVALVPYLAEHVPTYHEWMKDPHLQEATASEPLTLEEEYEMQRSWREDEDKCTFIVLDKEKWLASGNVVEPMVGDVNLFFNDHYDRGVAEAEIMIAEGEYRGKGYGREAMVLMLQYGIKELHVTKYIVRIGLTNTKSIELFKSLGFVEDSVSDVFQEITLAFSVSSTSLEHFASAYGQYESQALTTT